MVERIEVVLPDEVAKLLSDVCLVGDVQKFARTLLLQGLSCEYQINGNDDVARQIEGWIDKLESA